jgi:hypothetical protein
MVTVEIIRTSEMICHNVMFLVNEMKKPPPLFADGGPTTLIPSGNRRSLSPDLLE